MAPPKQIEKEFDGDLFEIKADNLHQFKNSLNEKFGEHSAHLFGQSIHFSLAGKTISDEQLLNMLDDNNLKPTSIKKINANIEDCFMRLSISNEAGSPKTEVGSWKVDFVDK